MYIAAIFLSFRGSRWGYFIGISVAGLSDYTNVFAITFHYNGLERLSEWVYTGHLERPDLLIAIPAWLANFVVIIGCVWGDLGAAGEVLGLCGKRLMWEKSDVGKLVLTSALTTRFLALDMYVFQPRYLGIFPRLLDRHLPQRRLFAISALLVPFTKCPPHV